MPRAPVSQVMLLMNKMIENACTESNEKFQRQKMLHKLLMLELGNANNLQQGKRGTAKESYEINDRNVEISTRTHASNKKSPQTEQYSPIAGHLSVILGPYTLMLTAYNRAQQQKQVVQMEPLKSINLSNVQSTIGTTCNHGTPITQYGVTIRRGYDDSGLPSYTEQPEWPAHDPPQRYNHTPMDSSYLLDSSYFMTMFLDALYGLPTPDANGDDGDDCDAPHAKTAPHTETPENAATTGAAENQPAAPARTPPLPAPQPPAAILPPPPPPPHPPPPTSPPVPPRTECARAGRLNVLGVRVPDRARCTPSTDILRLALRPRALHRPFHSICGCGARPRSAYSRRAHRPAARPQRTAQHAVPLNTRSVRSAQR